MKFIKFKRQLIKCACGCGEPITILIGAKSPQHNRRFKSGHNSKLSGHHPNWKGGKNINTQGYVMIYSPDHPFRDCDGYVREHRLVMEKHLKRLLTKNEIVHHINGNKQDNKIRNLKRYDTNSTHFVNCHKNQKRNELGQFIR